MCEKGQGVAQDFQQAAEWYRKAAEQGHAQAQFNLGELYRVGKGVAQDYIEAYKWFSIAGVGRGYDGLEASKIVGQLMTSNQIAEARRRTSS
jgi:hypothetical protein